MTWHFRRSCMHLLLQIIFVQVISGTILARWTSTSLPKLPRCSEAQCDHGWRTTSREGDAGLPKSPPEQRPGIVLVAGTSLVGGPATALVEEAQAQDNKIIVINLPPAIFDAVADVVIRVDVVIVLSAFVKAAETLGPG